MISFNKPQPTFGSKLWRMKKQLVACAGTPFPDRCVKCNAPADGFRLKRIIYWQPEMHSFGHNPLALILLVIRIGLAQKKVKLHIGLCPKHRAQRWQAISIGWFGALSGFILMFLGIMAFDSGWIFFVGFVNFVCCAVYGGVKGPMVSAAQITKVYVWISGVHIDFLDSLPEWPVLDKSRVTIQASAAGDGGERTAQQRRKVADASP
jgi:hypothetical protein